MAAGGGCIVAINEDCLKNIFAIKLFSTLNASRRRLVAGAFLVQRPTRKTPTPRKIVSDSDEFFLSQRHFTGRVFKIHISEAVINVQIKLQMFGVFSNESFWHRFKHEVKIPECDAFFHVETVWLVIKSPIFHYSINSPPTFWMFVASYFRTNTQIKKKIKIKNHWIWWNLSENVGSLQTAHATI